MTQIAVMLITVRRGHQQADISTFNLARGKSEQAFRGRAEGMDCSLLVDDHHRIRHGRKDGLEMGMADREALVRDVKLARGALILEEECAH